MRTRATTAAAATALATMLFAPALPGAAVSRATGEAGPARTVEADLTVHVRNRRALAPWWKAVHARRTERADVLLVGTSTFEGVGAGSWDNRLPIALQADLRSHHPVSFVQASGWVPAANFALYATPGLALPEPAPGVSTRFGLGSKAIVVTDDRRATFTFTGARVRVWYASTKRAKDPGTVAIDGGAPRALESDRTPGSGQFWDSGPLSKGAHRVTVRGTATGRQPIEAFEVFGSRRDAQAGIHVYDATHGGYSTAGFTPGASVAADRLWQVADAIKPALTVINLGTNDTAFDAPAAAVKANVKAMIARAETAADGPHSVLVVLPYVSVRADPEHAARLAGYRSALRRLAGGSVAVVDLDAYWPALVRGGGHETGLMLEDDYPVHPNPEGHARILDVLVSALGRGAGAVPAA